MGTVPSTPLLIPLLHQGQATDDENKALLMVGRAGKQHGLGQSKGKQGHKGWGRMQWLSPHSPWAAQLCWPQAGTGELHPKTGSCGEGLSSLMLLQWGEKGVKSRVGRDCPLSPWHAWPQEPGVMCRMEFLLSPGAISHPLGGMPSRRMLLLPLLTLHGPFSLQTACQALQKLGGIFPS